MASFIISASFYLPGAYDLSGSNVFNAIIMKGIILNRENEMSITTIQSIPLDIRKELSNPHIPWEISKRIFNEMKLQETTVSYKKVQVLPTDPEWRFVCRYFHQDKPHRYSIGQVYCIYESHQQQAFELNLSSIEKKSN